MKGGFIMRPTFRGEERGFWENWLPPDLGDRLTRIRQLVKHLINTKEKELHLKHFTPHGEDHCRAVEDILHRLIPGNMHKRLSEAEKFFLLSSAWLHDVGMLRGIFYNDDDISDEKIRDSHHDRSAKYITCNYSEVGVNQTEEGAFSLLAFYHRRRCEIAECSEYLTIPLHGKIRLRLLAAYLRLADALHIDQTRAPAKQYAISLTYNIPYKSKLHWLRCNFVLGTDIDTDAKEIIIHLKFPANEDNKDFNKQMLKPTFRDIYDFIIQDLNDEINSVKNVLFAGNISYFLKVTPKVHKVEFDTHFLGEINPVFNYYHLLDNPSSSALFNLVLESVGGILNSHSTTYEDNKIIESTIKESLMSFIKEINEHILINRKCHTGLSKLINEIEKEIASSSVKDFKDWIKKKKIILNEKRTSLRYSAYRYFTKVYQKSIDEITMKYHEQRTPKFNVLVYGYSELVMKTLCGFRDAVLESLLFNYCRDIEKNFKQQNDSSKQPSSAKYPLFHKVNFEREASDYFRIFCCEGQPKNHTAWEGRLLYHDGTRYALSLVERGFHGVHVIPDAVAPSLIASNISDDKFPQIDFVLVGANGFDERTFRHSAGHLMAVAASNFAKVIRGNNKSDTLGRSPVLILSVMSDKYAKKETSQSSSKVSEAGGIIEKGGWLFRSPFAGEAIRDNAFFTQDKNLQESLKEHEGKILFYNPREDTIPIEHVDVVISEYAYLVKESITNWAKKWTGENIANAKEDNRIK